jgi:hypothetical protein
VAEKSLDERALFSAFIEEFPEGRRVTGLLEGGEFDLAWEWIFHLTDNLRPAISDGLRAELVKFFDEDPEFSDRYRGEVRQHLTMLPTSGPSLSLT